eukprot:Skav232473  [mRNA]  locus=scaffold2877:157712:158720:+ [translate_table: standard]
MHQVLLSPLTRTSAGTERCRDTKVRRPPPAAPRSEVLLQLQPAAGHAAVTAAALHLAESGEVPFLPQLWSLRTVEAQRSASSFWQAAEAVKLVEPLAQSGQRGHAKLHPMIRKNLQALLRLHAPAVAAYQKPCGLVPSVSLFLFLSYSRASFSSRPNVYRDTETPAPLVEPDAVACPESARWRVEAMAASQAACSQVVRCPQGPGWMWGRIVGIRL